MTYATVMAAFDLDLPMNGVLAATRALGKTFNAAAIGVAAGQSSISPYFVEGPIAENFVAQVRQELLAKLGSIESRFRDGVAADVRAVEWRSAERLPHPFIVASACAADLLVVGRALTPANLMRGPDLPNLLMQAGRPVLVVPAEADSFAAGRILIAWKDTREARRAVSDALPLLRRAAQVQILTVEEMGHSPERASVSDVVQWLARHQVTADVASSAGDGDISRSLEAGIAAFRPDIVVAGAFGHSRFREWILGGVTRDLLANPTMSILFSH